jgi:hypothetical protein
MLDDAEQDRRSDARREARWKLYAAVVATRGAVLPVVTLFL